MVFVDKAMFFHQLSLQFFQFITIYFHETAAFNTNEVIMMFVAELMLESTYSITKINLGANTGIGKEFHCSGNSSITNVFVLLPYQIEKFLNAQMPFSCPKDIKYPEPLFCLPKNRGRSPACPALLSAQFLHLTQR